MEKTTMTPQELGVYLGIGRNSVYKLLAEEQFKTVRVVKLIEQEVNTYDRNEM